VVKTRKVVLAVPTRVEGNALVIEPRTIAEVRNGRVLVLDDLETGALVRVTRPEQLVNHPLLTSRQVVDLLIVFEFGARALLDVIDGGGRESAPKEIDLWVVPPAWIVILWSLEAIFKGAEFQAADVQAQVADGRTVPLKDALGDKLLRSPAALDGFLAELVGAPLGGRVLRSRTSGGAALYRIETHLGTEDAHS
jgi:hypothetical protein